MGLGVVWAWEDGRGNGVGRDGDGGVEEWGYSEAGWGQWSGKIEVMMWVVLVNSGTYLLGYCSGKFARGRARCLYVRYILRGLYAFYSATIRRIVFIE